MSSCENIFTGGRGFPFFKILLAAIVIAIIATTISHAHKHGNAALAGKLLCDGYQADQIYVNEKINRCVYATEEDSGKVFVQITEIVDGVEQEITFYTKQNWAAVIRTVIKKYGYTAIP